MVKLFLVHYAVKVDTKHLQAYSVHLTKMDYQITGTLAASNPLMIVKMKENVFLLHLHNIQP